MSKTKPMSSTEILQRIIAAQRKQDDVVPEGFKTARELGREWGKSAGYTGRLIAIAIENSIMEKRELRSQGRLTPFYGPVQ